MRVIVADDELQARKRITRLLEELTLDVVAACASGEEVLACLPKHRPELLVLDISMPGLSGLELHARVGDVPVIYVTAHAHHAVQAFELGAVDYVMKPVTAARLAKAVARVRPGSAEDRAERLPIETRAGVILVDPAAIVYAQFDGTLVTLVGALESWITTLTLKELEARLPAQFARVDRRHLLNLDEVARLEPERDGGYRAITRTGAVVPVSRQAARDLRRRLAL